MIKMTKESGNMFKWIWESLLKKLSQKLPFKNLKFHKMWTKLNILPTCIIILDNFVKSRTYLQM